MVVCDIFIGVETVLALVDIRTVVCLPETLAREMIYKVVHYKQIITCMNACTELLCNHM